jgi:ribosomal protein S12 methylthiotransferase
MKGRHPGQAPEIDGQVFLSGGEAHVGQIRRVRVSQASDYDLVGELIDEGTPVKPLPKSNKRVSLKVLTQREHAG